MQDAAVLSCSIWLRQAALSDLLQSLNISLLHLANVVLLPKGRFQRYSAVWRRLLRCILAFLLSKLLLNLLNLQAIRRF